MVKNTATEVDLDTWDCIFQSKLEELQRPEQWILGLHEDEEPGRGWRQYMLQAFASFRCSTCDRWWESARVRIIFHIRQAFFRGEDNLVNMRIFKQSCQLCRTGELEEAEFLIENIAVAMDRLVTRILTKCYDEDLSDRPVPAFITNERKGGVHDTTHCEACRLGLCHWKLQTEKRDGPPSTGQGSHVTDKSMSLMGEKQDIKGSQQMHQEESKKGVHDTAHCEKCHLGLCHLQAHAQKKAVQPTTGEGSHFYNTLHSQEKEIPNVWEIRQRNREMSKGGVQPTVGEGSHFYDTLHSQLKGISTVWDTIDWSQEASKGGFQPAMGEGSHFYDPLRSQKAETNNARKSRQNEHKTINPSIARVNTNHEVAAAARVQNVIAQDLDWS